MTYTDENGITAFVQQDDLFEWGGLGMDRQQSKAWFLEMLDKTNRALYGQDDKSVF